MCLARTLSVKNRLALLAVQKHSSVCYNRLGAIYFVWQWKSTDSKSKNVGKQESGNSGSELDVARENPYANLTFGQKVKEAGKDVSYFGISLAALGMLGALFYYIGKELFSSESPNGVYSKALKRCANDSEVTVVLGHPIKGYGEETRRGRRRHVSHVEFEQDGRKHMRMKFYIQGSDRKAEVNLEVVKDDSGVYNYRYLFVQLDQFPYKTLILEDNR